MYIFRMKLVTLFTWCLDAARHYNNFYFEKLLSEFPLRNQLTLDRTAIKQLA